MNKLRVLDLFSGLGGFSLGLERTGGFETVAFCEIEDFPRRVLAKHWPKVPIHQDVRKLKGQDVGPVDVICGGYPCQPFSTAGRRKGAKDDRHLWPEFSRLVDELRPTWVIGENVAGHISMGLDDVLSDLEGKGYAARPFVIPACAVDAPHRRDRTWVVGHANGARYYSAEKPCIRGPQNCQGFANNAGNADYTRKALANANHKGLQGRQEARNAGSIRAWGVQLTERCAHMPRAAWLPEPNVGRVAHGVPRRVDRLKSLGNAVVPQIPEMIGHAILAAERGA